MDRDDSILSVSALTAAIKGNLEEAFPFVWVRGQVTNLSRPSSGHVYFSLRDEQSSLAAVWFKSGQKPVEIFNPLTGEVFEGGAHQSLARSLENGHEVICAGRITVYGARGAYQLVVELAQEAGFGRLHKEFERLKRKLDGLGYFAPKRKRPLPTHPSRVAVITAPSGAAVHDFLRVGAGRGLAASVRIYPAPMQGEGAPSAIILALQRAAEWAEVLVLVRGGGSIEDLWAFNDPKLAGFIFESPVPVLAGIGHEVDFTLSDLTADVRASTPTHAAQLLWPERAELAARLRSLTEGLAMAQDRTFSKCEEGLAALVRLLRWQSPKRRLFAMQERLSTGSKFLTRAGNLLLERAKIRLTVLDTRLLGWPGRLPEKRLELQRLGARLGAAGSSKLDRRDESLRSLAANLAKKPGVLLDRAAHRLELLQIRLESLNPHAPLKRGYALAVKTSGSIVRRRQDVTPGESLRLMVSDGAIPVRVEDEENAPH